MKLRSLFFLLIAIAFISCSDSKKQEGEDPLEYSVEVAKVVNYVTGGDIMPNSVIEVQFINGVVSEEQINQPLETNPFNFSPSIQGQAIWKGSNKLIFEPSNELDSRETYSGTLDLTALSDEFKEKTVQEVNLKFSIIGRDINIFKGDLELQNPNNPKVLVYRGKVSFNMETSLEDLKSSTTFGSKNIKWSPENSKTFSFISEGIERTSSNQSFKFQIERDELDLETILEKTVVVTPLKEMSVTQVQQLEEGKAPAIQLQFSDNLDKTQELSGFINISPQTEFKIQQLGRFLLLEGKFKYGQSYKIELAEGIKSKWGTKTGSKIVKNVSFKDIPPQVEFASDGIFMPTTNNKRLQFMTSNLSRVHIEVKKVFNNDIENFFNREQINSLKNRNAEFRNTYISSIGAIVYNETLEIGDSKNEWLLHEVDFSGVLNEFDNGLYLVRLNFNPKDMLVDVKGDDLKFIQKHGQVFKPFTISDIGILAKWSNNKYQVFTTDLKTGKPLEGVSLQSRYQSSGYSTAVTNAQGIATLSAYKNRTVVARKDGQVSVLKPYEMKWNNSGFNVGGISTFGLETRAYIYTERGVYRPGDSINISCIARFKSNRSTSGPAYLKVFNPEGTMVIQQTDSDAEDGFYNFKIKTDENAPTGNWNANISIGNKRFYHTLKIETVVANRLKVKVDPSLRTILPENNTIDIEVEAKYLFGATAGELPYETEVEIFDVAPNFPKFKDYKFGNRNFNFQDIRSKISSGRLNSDGTVNIEWIVPSLKQSPSPLKVKFTTSVSEEGGRPNHSWAYADLHPFSHYVGIKFDRWNVRLNSKNEIPVVVVNHEGESVAGRELSYRIYRNDSYWWYQYDNYRDFRRKYKTDKHSFLVDEGSVTSGKGLTTIPFQPSQKGYYFIEIEDAVSQGHTSGIFVSAYPYGGIPTSDKNEGTLALLTEKDSYEVGEEATISFPSPKAGNILLTVEQGDLVLSSKWIMPDPDAEDQEIKVPITKEMVPNAYITLTAIQEHAQTVNDRPLRMFGILPIGVTDKSTNQELLINMADELKPKEKFDIEIKSADGKPTQFTIAVVDEGLLDLTNYKTPDPKKEFFKKIRLEVETYDLFAHVIGANADDVFKTFSIGGDEDYRESQLDPFEKKKRFKPICMFKGPVSTDGTGKAKVSFEMPNYVGSVRVMVVGARGNTYSSAEKTVPVRSDLIVQPTIPRALKPGDEFEIPVNVFATKENIGEVDIKIETEGPLTVIGSKSFKHSFQTEDDKLFKYKLKVNEAVGQAKIIIKGISKTATSVSETDIGVVPSAAREYVQETKIVKPGESIQFDIPKVGLDGTNNARIYASQFPNMDFMHRLEWLVRYPYGCIEQTTSSVYPQLVLKELYSKNSIRWKQVDTNINAGIERLNLFQTPNGGFSYWPGGATESTWGSNYAAQFLIEAKDKGFHVPDHMYDGVIRYLERQSKRSQNETENWQLMTRVNRCFVLAQAGKAPMQEMNLIRQNHYDKLKSVQKWQLMAAYKLAGAEDKIESLIGAIDLDVEDYNEFAYTYGSTYRDLGIILRCLVILDKSEQSALVAKDVASKLSGKYWYSTQTLGQMLLGIAEYFKYAGISVQEEVIIRGTTTLPGDNEVEFEEVNDYRLYIDKGYGEKLTFSLDQDVDAKQLYVSLSANGVPLTDKTKDEEKNIRLDVTWFNEDGDVISIDQLVQGSTVYGKYTVNNSSALPQVDEVALVQLLPSGWEIENMRLSGEVLPEWTKGWNLGREEYVDIRDDRIMWFFDLNGSRRLNFLVKINAIAEGTYSMPGARCEAMYNNDFVATKRSKQVIVKVEDK